MEIIASILLFFINPMGILIILLVGGYFVTDKRISKACSICKNKFFYPSRYIDVPETCGRDECKKALEIKKNRSQDSDEQSHGLRTRPDQMKYVLDQKEGNKYQQATESWLTGDGFGYVDYKKKPLQGYCTLTSPADGWSYVGEFKAGKWHGRGTITYSDGRKYVGSWAGHQKHGQGKFYFADGSKYSGDWKKDYEEGHGEKIYPDGSKYVGDWVSGMEHGHGKMIYADGRQYIGKFDAGFI